MKLNYLLIINDFLNEKISFFEFKIQTEQYLERASIIDINNLKEYLLDESFTMYNSDLVMLVYIYLWLYDNRFNKLAVIEGADNIYQTFIKSIIDEYNEDLEKPQEIVSANLNYEIIKRGELYIIINATATDLTITLPAPLQNQCIYCINCAEEINVTDNIELYPHGFYLLIK